MSIVAAFQSLFPALSIVGGVFSILSGIHAYRWAIATSSWLPVPAKILRSRVVWDGRYYAPEVAYRYTVDGREYESPQLRIVSFSSNIRSVALGVVSRYPATSSATAYVDPANHEEAVLEPGPQPLAALGFLATGIVLLGFGVYGYLAVLRPPE